MSRLYRPKGMDSMSDTVIVASSDLRKRIVLVAVPAFLVGLAILCTFETYVARLIPVDPALAEQLLINAFHFLAVFMGLIAMGLTGGIGSILLRIIIASHYPPPGQPWPWNAPVRTGMAATRPAYIGLIILGVFFILGMIACFFIWSLGRPLPPPTSSPLQMV